jgi:hypothetical protein
LTATGTVSGRIADRPLSGDLFLNPDYERWAIPGRLNCENQQDAGGRGDPRNWHSYFGNGDAVVIDLAAARVRARPERMKANRAAACGIRVGDSDFDALQLQRAECAMS